MFLLEDAGRERLLAVVVENGDDSLDDDGAGVVITSYSIHYTKLYDELFADGRLKIEGRRVRIVPPLPYSPDAMVNPPLI